MLESNEKSLNLIWIFIMLVQSCHVLSLEIIFGGDISFHGPIEYHLLKEDCSFNRPFVEVKKLFRRVDNTVINLETTLGELKRLDKFRNDDKLITFLSDPKSVKGLRNSHITAVTVANNHFLDYGEIGANSTIRFIRQEGLKISGLSYGKEHPKPQEPVVFEKDGVRVCLLSYCFNKDGCTELRNMSHTGQALFINFQKVLEEIDGTRKKYSPTSIIVYLHQGMEYRILSGMQKQQKELFDKLAGHVDVVVESHTHVTSGHFYHNKTLFTGQLGNLLFPLHSPVVLDFDDQSEKKKKEMDDKWFKISRRWSNPSVKSKLVKLSFDRNGLIPIKSRYMYAFNKVDKHRCMYIKPSKKGWRKICAKGDQSCEGTSDCSMLQCKT
ncbi:PGA biosynthesis protein CapA-like [Clytia hemisphaerica]